MRDVFSLRFFAAVGAIVALVLLVATAVSDGDGGVIDADRSGRPDASAVDADAAPYDPFAVERRIDLVDQVFVTTDPELSFDAAGQARSDNVLVLDGGRRLQVVAGTFGVDLCPGRGEIGRCAVVADLLGEAVVWFALVPMGPNGTVEMPAIDTLDDGVATLVNGWQLPFASVLDRRCVDDEFESYQSFRAQLGDDFVTIYSLEERRIAAVRCRERVGYAPTTTVAGDGDGTDAITTSTTVAGAETP